MKSEAAVLALLICTAGVAHSEQSIEVKSQGETTFSIHVSGTAVEVKLRTHRVEIGKPSDGRPAHSDSSCTYSRHPCSVVDGLEIRVNGAELPIPRSVFCDLADVNRAAVAPEKSGFLLTLYGGDASEAYVAKVAFTTREVKRKTLFSSILLDQPTQETVYHRRTIGD